MNSLALALFLHVLAGQVCSTSAPAPVLPTAELRGDSLFQGGSCAGATTTPAQYIDANLPGGAAAGWLVLNRAVTGETAAQIRSRYVTEEATACLGERCAVLLLNGATNSLRLGVAPATALADMLWVADDARAKRRRVVLVGVPPYGGFAGAGANPLGQATTYNQLLLDACTARAADTVLRCVFPYATFVDPASPGFMLPSCTCDGVHFVQTCSNQFAALVLAALQSLL